MPKGKNRQRSHSRFMGKLVEMDLLKRMDRYIIRKYLGTFFFSLLMLMAIVVVFDYNEKFDKFTENAAPTSAVLFEYFANFIPYFAVKFSPMFIFISVVFFTSKMAANTEVIAILAGGVSFRRMMRPYMISAVILTIIVFLLSSFVIPPGNQIRLNFEDRYVSKVTKNYARNVQMEIEPGVIIYIERFDEQKKIGYRFFMEKYKDLSLVSRMTAQRINMTGENQWKLTDYQIRDFDGMQERIQMGGSLDTTIMMDPSEFMIVKGFSEQLTTSELKQYLDRQKKRGVANIKEYEVEYHRRYSFPVSIVILTVIGVSLASRKVKGGTGLHIGLGLLIAFSYILFDTLSGAMALSGNISPFVAVWMPNVIYVVIAGYLYIKAPK